MGKRLDPWKYIYVFTLISVEIITVIFLCTHIQCEISQKFVSTIIITNRQKLGKSKGPSETGNLWHIQRNQSGVACS